MSTISVYRFEDRRGNEASSWQTQDYEAAKKFAAENGYRIMIDEYEYSDSTPDEHGDFTPFPMVRLLFDRATGRCFLHRDGDDFLLTLSSTHLGRPVTSLYDDVERMRNDTYDGMLAIPFGGADSAHIEYLLDREGIHVAVDPLAVVTPEAYERVAESDGTTVTEALYNVDDCDLPYNVLRYIDVDDLCRDCQRPYRDGTAEDDYCAACRERRALT